ncbi:hypothetical protein [Proteiniborus sp. DW1]|uniref:hypothetical protein n=1 Tax=Proteiniborus sp. DW1 TaxID=1889883 RepID=UPI00117BA992|nr:hypothetical protein [Proteiniborus sp. DW1]
MKVKRLTPFKKKIERLQNSLIYTIENFRKADDNTGLNFFLISIEDLENLLESHQKIDNLNMIIHQVLPKLHILYNSMKSCDVAEMIDILEYGILPATEEWIRECDSSDYS